MGGGQVNITIVDNGGSTIVVPGASVQLAIGCASSGPTNQIVSTKSPSTLQSVFGGGPLVEAAGLAASAGGTILAIRTPTVTAGAASAVAFTGTGTSIITVTGAPVDTYYVLFKVVAGGTVGTAGITFQLSLDAGRNFGPVLALGAANTYAIPGTGITLNFGAGTLVAGDQATFGTTEPLWNTAGIQAALQVFQASQYALQGVGSTHVIGKAAGADVSTIQGMLDALATGYIYTRSFFSARDASPATKWGGTGETESTWMSALLTDYASVQADRACVGAAYWNMPSAFAMPAVAGLPSYRRPVAWAAAARQVVIPPQRHLGRVRDGALSQIVVDAANDPLDGFVYHDERFNPGLDYIIAGAGGRFMSTMTRKGKAGVFITNPLTMAQLGSSFFLMPKGSVMDVFCDIINEEAQDIIDDDVRTNNNGTIYENDARNYETALAAAANDVLFAQGMISQPILAGPSAPPGAGSVVVDRTLNVQALNRVDIVATMNGKAYVLSVNVTAAFAAAS